MKKTGYIIVISLVSIGALVGGFFLYRKITNKGNTGNAEKTTDENSDESSTDEGSETASTAINKPVKPTGKPKPTAIVNDFVYQPAAAAVASVTAIKPLPKVQATDIGATDLKIGMKGKNVLWVQFWMNYVNGTKMALTGVYDSSLQLAATTYFGYFLGNSIDYSDIETLRAKAVAKAGSIAQLSQVANANPDFVRVFNSFN